MPTWSPSGSPSSAAIPISAWTACAGARTHPLANIGAYLSAIRSLLATFSNVQTLVGVYYFPTAHATVLCLHSNTSPRAPYRGAGRPEATYVIERMIDEAAVELDLDQTELRRRNMIAPERLPLKTPLGGHYDYGGFAANLDEPLKMADYDGFPARRAASQAAGKLRGIGLAHPIESAGAPSM